MSMIFAYFAQPGADIIFVLDQPEQNAANQLLVILPANLWRALHDLAPIVWRQWHTAQTN
jgi:hypothetical protein